MATQTMKSVPVVPRPAASRPSLTGGAPLPPAVDGERRTYRSHVAGEVATYVSEGARGVPLVLVHSLNAAASSYEMRPLFEAFKYERPVIAVDLPGFGGSDRSDRHYTREFYAAFLEEFLSSISTTKGSPHVVALSLASEFVSRVALKSPKCVTSLSLVSPTGLAAKATEVPTMQEQARRGTAGLARRVLGLDIVGGPLFALLRSRPSIRYFLQKSFIGDVDEGLAEYAYATSHQPGARHAPLAFLSGVLFDPRVREAVYERVSVPTTMLFDKDDYTSFEMLASVLERNPNVSATRISGTRGLPQFDRPEETVAALREHFERAEAAKTERAPVSASTLDHSDLPTKKEAFPRRIIHPSS